MFRPQRKVCFNRNVDAVVLPHPFSGLAKGVLSTKIHYHPLQALRVTAVAHSGALAERPQFGTTSAQPKQLLLQFQRTERGEPSYFFLMCLMPSGCLVRARSTHPVVWLRPNRRASRLQVFEVAPSP